MYSVSMESTAQPKIYILWQGLSHWPSKLSWETLSTGQRHAGLIRGPPAIVWWEQCILGGDRDGLILP